MRQMTLFLIFLSLAISFPAYSKDSPDTQSIKRKMIQDSISGYTGNCPCPYSTMKNGRACGRRSAYSRPGGRSPICYETDITPEMIEKYRKTPGDKK